VVCHCGGVREQGAEGRTFGGVRAEQTGHDEELHKWS